MDTLYFFFWKPVWIYMRLVLLASCIFFPCQFTRDETDLKYGEYRCVKWGRSSLQRASYRLSKRILILFSSQILNTSRIFFLERTIYFWYFYTKRKEASKLITLVYLDFFFPVYFVPSFHKNGYTRKKSKVHIPHKKSKIFA